VLWSILYGFANLNFEFERQNTVKILFLIYRRIQMISGNREIGIVLYDIDVEEE